MISLSGTGIAMASQELLGKTGYLAGIFLARDRQGIAQLQWRVRGTSVSADILPFAEVFLAAPTP